jgi:hypothetical protein
MYFKVSNSLTGDTFSPGAFTTEAERMTFNRTRSFEAICFYHAMLRCWSSGRIELDPNFIYEPNHSSNNERARVYLYTPHRRNPRPTYIVVTRTD